MLLAALGAQCSLAAIVLVKPGARDTSGLSDWGAFALHPEREAPLYLAAVTATLLLATAAALYRRRASSEGGGKLLRMLTSGPVQAGAAALGTLLTPAVLSRMRPFAAALQPFPSAYPALLAALMLATAGLLAVAILAPDTAASRPAPAGERRTGLARLRLSAWDFAVPVAIALLLYVPEYRLASGRLFLEENNIHWDLFAAGPALMFRHGEALGTEAHSYYGAGWPMVFAALARWVPITYGRMIQLGSVYLCIYLSGLYLLLRVLVRRPALAAIGTGLVLVPFFWWLFDLYLWRAPNVTPLRWALDVWCFLALLQYARSRRRGWALAAGAGTGLAVVFNINAGLELAAAAGVFLAGAYLAARSPEALKDLALAVLLAAGTAAAGLAAAGRGGVFRLSFWEGWLKEPLVFSSLPLLTGVTPPTLFWFGGLVFFYLAVACWSIAGLVSRRASMVDWLAGCIAVYGLMLLIKFVRYSSDQTFFRLLTPALILVTCFAARAWSRFEERDPAGGRRLGRLANGAAAAGLAAMLAGPWTGPLGAVGEYPGLLSTVQGGRPPEGVCLMAEPRDLCGLPPGFAPVAERFQEISDRLTEVQSQGGTFAVVDENGALFSVATDTAPYWRYPRIFFTAITVERLEEITGFFRDNPPDWVLVKQPVPAGSPNAAEWAAFGQGPVEETFYPDMWASLTGVVDDRYLLDSTLEPYQLWRLGQTPG